MNIGHRIRRRIKILCFARVGHDFPVLDFNNPAGLRGDACVMRHQNNRMPLTMQIFNNPHHHFTAFGIKCTGRFVGQNNVAAVHQRAGNAHTLLLSAGKLVRPVVQFVAELQFF